MTDPDITELPPRAQVGYVLKHSTVTAGDLTPGMIVTILRGKGVAIDDEAEMLEIAEDVLIRRGLITDAV